MQSLIPASFLRAHTHAPAPPRTTFCGCPFTLLARPPGLSFQILAARAAKGAAANEVATAPRLSTAQRTSPPHTPTRTRAGLRLRQHFYVLAYFDFATRDLAIKGIQSNKLRRISLVFIIVVVALRDRARAERTFTICGFVFFPFHLRPSPALQGQQQNRLFST